MYNREEHDILKSLSQTYRDMLEVEEGTLPTAAPTTKPAKPAKPVPTTNTFPGRRVAGGTR